MVVVESADTDLGSVFFIGRESFRMQVAGTPGPVRNDVPNGAPETPTERIFERRRRRTPVEPAINWAPPPKPAISKTTLVGICLTTFACGMLVATAFDRMRPRAVVAQPVAVAHVQAPSGVEIQPLPPAVPELPPLPAVTIATAEAPAIAAPTPAVAARAPVTKPALAKPTLATTVTTPARPAAPAVRAKQPTSTIEELMEATTPFTKPAAKPAAVVDPFATEPAYNTLPTTPPALKAAPAPKAAPVAKATAPSKAPPAPSKWVDPFAE